MMEHVRNVETWVLTTLQDGANFRLAPGERVHSVAAYNHVVRCSGERGHEGGRERAREPGLPRRGQSPQMAQQSSPPAGDQPHKPHKGRPSHPAGDLVINEVHSDFTRASGVAVQVRQSS
jgi:hypothetical protein